ncbi:MAG: hypothetical protein NUV84_04855 [Candidatus Uhrbacteria bacterium]|nr:hypothetical protein [Candidatus Uhrbacteria bacterium]
MSIGLGSRGISKVETLSGFHPIISKRTVALMEELGDSKNDFGRACDCYRKGAEATAYDGRSCEGIANEAALEAATRRRKTAASELDPGLLTAWVLGVIDKTHSTWQCSGTASESIFDLRVGFTPTYDTPAS